MLLWWAAPHYPALALFAFWMGLSYGGIVSLMPALCMDLYGARAVSSIIGALYTGAALGNAAGPWVAGLGVRFERQLRGGHRRLRAAVGAGHRVGLACRAPLKTPCRGRDALRQVPAGQETPPATQNGALRCFSFLLTTTMNRPPHAFAPLARWTALAAAAALTLAGCATPASAPVASPSAAAPAPGATRPAAGPPAGAASAPTATARPDAGRAAPVCRRQQERDARKTASCRCGARRKRSGSRSRPSGSASPSCSASTSRSRSVNAACTAARWARAGWSSSAASATRCRWWPGRSASAARPTRRRTAPSAKASAKA